MVIFWGLESWRKFISGKFPWFLDFMGIFLFWGPFLHPKISWPGPVALLLMAQKVYPSYSHSWSNLRLYLVFLLHNIFILIFRFSCLHCLQKHTLVWHVQPSWIPPLVFMVFCNCSTCLWLRRLSAPAFRTLWPSSIRTCFLCCFWTISALKPITSIKLSTSRILSSAKIGGVWTIGAGYPCCRSCLPALEPKCWVTTCTMISCEGPSNMMGPKAFCCSLTTWEASDRGFRANFL